VPGKFTMSLETEPSDLYVVRGAWHERSHARLLGFSYLQQGLDWLMLGRATLEVILNARKGSPASQPFIHLEGAARDPLEGMVVFALHAPRLDF
jgi:hypothetical protein